MHLRFRTVLIGLTTLSALTANWLCASPPSVDVQETFFDHIAALQGQAFEGKVTEGNVGDQSFKESRLVMHVWKREGNALFIPFHVGEDRSRTWILRKIDAGLQLKHDHRKPDGSHDASTMYGGHTDSAGWSNAQTFPADRYSKELFVRMGIPQSTENSWHLFIYPGDTFTYRLTRPGREFRVDFDLKNPVPLPPLPWGHQD